MRDNDGNRLLRLDVGVSIVALNAVPDLIAAGVRCGGDILAPLAVLAEAVFDGTVRGRACRDERVRRAVVFKVFYGFGKLGISRLRLFDFKRNYLFRSRIIVRSLDCGFDEILAGNRGHGGSILAVLVSRIGKRRRAEFCGGDGLIRLFAVEPIRDSQARDFIVRFGYCEFQRNRGGVALVGRFPRIALRVGKREHHVVVAGAYAAVVGRDGVTVALGHGCRLLLARVNCRNDYGAVEHGFLFRFGLGFTARKACKRRNRNAQNRNRESYESPHFSAPFSHL